MTVRRLEGHVPWGLLEGDTVEFDVQLHDRKLVVQAIITSVTRYPGGIRYEARDVDAREFVLASESSVAASS